MYVNLLVELYSHSKEQLLDVLQFQLPNKDAVEKMREIRNVGLEDELGHYWAPLQVNCCLRPARKTDRTIGFVPHTRQVRPIREFIPLTSRGEC